MNHALHTEIDIDAPASVVWKILTDLEGYADWNPFIVSSKGTVVVGARLTNRMQPPDSQGITFRPTVTKLIPGQTFEWLGRLGMPGIFDGRHRFDLQAGPNGGTRLIHGEELSGVLVRFMRTSLDTQTLAGFEAMNQALKARAEATVGAWA